MRNQPDLIGSVETCRRLGIDRSTLSRWVKDGKLAPAMQLPGPTGAMLFAPVDVDALKQTLNATP